MHSFYWGKKKKKTYQTYSLSFIEEKWYNFPIWHQIWAKSYWKWLQRRGRIDLEHLVGVLDPVFTIYDMHETIEDMEDGWL